MSRISKHSQDGYLAAPTELHRDEGDLRRRLRSAVREGRQDEAKRLTRVLFASKTSSECRR